MSRTRVILAAIVVVGFGVRMAYLASDPQAVKSQYSYYGELARNIVAGRGFSKNKVAYDYTFKLHDREHRLMEPAVVDYAPLDKHGEWQPESEEPVGGPLLLAGIWEVTGREYYLPLQILQAIVDALCALLIFRISMRLFRRRTAALAAAALYALYLPIAWQTTVVYNDIWAVDFTIAIVAAYLEAIDSAHAWRWLTVCGLLTGVGVYFRPNLLILPAILALATIPGGGWRRTLARAAVPTVIAVALLVPWTIRNYEDFHTFIFVRSALGITVWVGLGEIPNGFGGRFDEASAIAKVHGIRPDLRPETPEWDNALLKRFVIPTIESHPSLYSKILARRTLRSTLFNFEKPWMSGSVPPVRGRSPGALASFAVAHPVALLGDALQPLFFLLAMLTMGLTWRRWRRQHIFLLAVCVSVIAPFIVIWFEARYILPVLCAYVVWIGLGIDLLAQRAGRSLKVRRTRLAGTPAV